MADNKYLVEAFQALEELNEDMFNLTSGDATELKDFVSDDIEMDQMTDIIDPLAQSEEDLQDSYLGKAILDCIICQSKIYKDPSEVIISEQGDLANVGEECPYCQSADGFKIIGQVAEYNPEETEEETEDQIDDQIEEKESITEGVQKVDIETDSDKVSMQQDEDGKVVVTTEPKDQINIENKEEVISPISAETEAEFTKEDDGFEDIEIDEFEEEDFDSLGEGYLKRVYENVAKYKTVKGSVNGNKLKLEGIITFKSGKQVKTNFVFESKSITKTGKLKFIGENKQFAKGKNAFTLTGKMKGSKLLAESLTYNYRAKDAKGASKKLYGRICK